MALPNQRIRTNQSNIAAIDAAMPSFSLHTAAAYNSSSSSDVIRYQSGAGGLHFRPSGGNAARAVKMMVTQHESRGRTFTHVHFRGTVQLSDGSAIPDDSYVLQILVGSSAYIPSGYKRSFPVSMETDVVGIIDVETNGRLHFRKLAFTALPTEIHLDNISYFV